MLTSKLRPFKSGWCSSANKLQLIVISFHSIIFSAFLIFIVIFHQSNERIPVINQPNGEIKLPADTFSVKRHVLDFRNFTFEVFTEDKNLIKHGDGGSCTFPDIDPFDPAIMAFTVKYPPITCTGRVPNLVYVDGDVIKVNHHKLHFVGMKYRYFKECRYKSVARKPGSDSQTVVLHISQPFNDSITLRDNDDNLVVECYSRFKTVLSRSYFSLIRVKQFLELELEESFKKHLSTHAPKEVINVLLVGMDGTSKQNFQRQMPMTRNYLLNILNATELNKHNKLGDNTFPNVFPLLTGQSVDSLHQKGWTWDEHFDRLNDDFLWSDFHKAGYRTGMFFDHTWLTAFHYEKKGWNKSPVDYYLRPTIIELERDPLMKIRHHCVGEVPEITHNHNFWIQMASTFNDSLKKPFFGYSFSVHLTHDDENMASAGDELYLRFLQELKEKNILNNTIIVFFSDHGQRFGKSRSTYNGMVESNTPFVFLIFPPWFHRKYPDLMTVLKINQERLTTNYDLYETLRDLLNFQANTGYGDVTKRGISLFQEIPRERTCQHAGISEVFCVCNQLTQTNVSSSLSLALAGAVMDRIRSLAYSHPCKELFLQSIQSVMRIQRDTNEDIQDEVLYRITMTTEPNNAIYEAIVVYSKSSKAVAVIGDIIRLNFYKGQDRCMRIVKLKPFCLC